MNWHDSKSKAVKRFAYDSAKNILTVDFHSTGIYHYHGVTQEKFDAFKSAASHGTHISLHLAGKHNVTR